ncbi:MAG: hypothetical protein OER82_05575 [Nitrosopumilus sp.]|nr:hypothetical protein [Nitrosopumilus sp.]
MKKLYFENDYQLMEYFINVYSIRKVIGFLKKIKDINEKGLEKGAEVGTRPMTA